MIKSTLLFICLLIITACTNHSKSEDHNIDLIKYNIIKPGNGIYVIAAKDVTKEDLANQNYEAIYYDNSKIVRIERYNSHGDLTDDFSVASTTHFEYDKGGKVKYVKYFDRDGNNWEDEIFGYWSIEYIYDDQGKVRMEIYRDAESKFLEVPRDNVGNIAKINFIAPVLTYEYLGDKLKIKALDQNFNLLKEVIGDKPCIPFIDCGEYD